jgi:hypothetical protein
VSDLDVVDMRIGGDFTGQHKIQCWSAFQPRRGERVLLEDCVEDCVSETGRLTCQGPFRHDSDEEKIICHCVHPKD